jgi:hypothetical protein
MNRGERFDEPFEQQHVCWELNVIPGPMRSVLMNLMSRCVAAAFLLRQFHLYYNTGDTILPAITYRSGTDLGIDRRSAMSPHLESALQRTFVIAALGVGHAAAAAEGLPVPDESLGDTLVQLAGLGFIGAAFGLFLLAALVIVWGKNSTPEEMKTKRLYITLAFASVIIAAGVHVYTRTAGTVIVMFSPELGETIPVPMIRNGTVVLAPGKIDITEDRTLVIVLDKVLRKVQDLSRTNEANQQAIIEFASRLGEDPIGAQEGG